MRREGSEGAGVGRDGGDPGEAAPGEARGARERGRETGWAYVQWLDREGGLG